MNRVLPGCRRAVYTDLVLYGYFMRPGSIVRSGFKPKSMDIFPILQDRIGILKELGCDALVKQTCAWLFQTAAWQYCLARRGGFRQEAAQLKKTILALAGEPGLPLSGQYKLLYQVSKITSWAPALYYLLRRVTGKT